MLYLGSSFGIANKKVGILLQVLGEQRRANNLRENILVLKRRKAHSSNVNLGKDGNNTDIRKNIEHIRWLAIEREQSCSIYHK